MIDGLDRLRLHPVIGGHHQHHDVGHLRAALAHGGKGLVPGRVDEGDLLPSRSLHLIGADMLGDAAGLLGDDVGRADGVEQRGLAVVDMAHDRHDRRARLQILGVVVGADETFLDIGLRDAPRRMPELLGDELGRVGIDHIGDLMHLAVLHQIFDDVDAALGHAVGEFLDGDDFGDHHVALNLGLRLRTGDLLLLALLAALQRGKAALTLLLVERVDDGEASPDPALFAAAGRRDALLVARIGGARGLFRLLLDEMLAHGLFADLARLGLGLEPLLLLALALGGLLALLVALLLGHDIEGGGLLGLLALLRLAHARVLQSALAGVLLVVGKLPQHDATPPRLGRLGLGFLSYLGAWRGRRGLNLFGRLRPGGADRPALLLLDQNGLRAPVAEALPHMAGLHRPAHVERHLARSASGFAFSLVGFAHSLSVSDPFWLANAARPLR